MISAHYTRDHEKAERIATTLVEYPDLPPVHRARACMILGQSTCTVVSQDCHADLMSYSGAAQARTVSERHNRLERANEGLRSAELAISELEQAGKKVDRHMKDLLKDTAAVRDTAQKVMDDTYGKRSLRKQAEAEREVSPIREVRTNEVEEAGDENGDDKPRGPSMAMEVDDGASEERSEREAPGCCWRTCFTRR